LIVGVEAGLLVEFIKAYFGERSPDDVLLHVDWRVRTEHGHVERFVADGKGAQVVEALDVFERRLRDL
jgi:hypothetical protein